MLALCGCNSIDYTRQEVDGTVVNVKSRRAFWSTDGYTVELGKDSAKLTAKKSRFDEAIVEAATRGAVQGATR